MPSEEAQETEILDAVAAAAEVLTGAEHADEAMEQQHMSMPVDHLPVHNPVQHNEEQPEAVSEEEAVKTERLSSAHHRQQPEEHDEDQREAHQEEMQHVINMTLEELNASLHEPPIDFDSNDSTSMLNAIKALQHTQRQQTGIILAMREMIHELQMDQSSKPAEYAAAGAAANAHTEGGSAAQLKSSAAKQRQKLPLGTPYPIKYQAALIATQLQSSLPDEGHPPVFDTTDEHIDSIIHNKKNGEMPCWPAHRLKKWIEEEDLQKIRLHRSVKYAHVPVRIPRTDKNKEGRLICKLCSGGKCNRNTTWMCSTCEVPLCVDTVDGDMHLTHHVLWHRCVDLREEHERCNALLRERRMEKKRGGGIRIEERPSKRERLMGGVLHRVHEGQYLHQQHEEQHDMHTEGEHGAGVHEEEHEMQEHEQVVDMEPVNVHVGPEHV